MIPNKVKIGSIIYDIDLVDCDNSEFSELKLFGSIDHIKNKITIVKSLNKQRTWQTLFHEVLHAIDFDYQTNLSEENLTRLANGFYQVLIDNNFLHNI